MGSDGRRAAAECGKPAGIDPLAFDGGQSVMNRWPGLVPETLPIEIRQRVVAACERFESARGKAAIGLRSSSTSKAWGQSSARPPCTDWLPSSSNCGVKTDDPPTLREYVNRFPGDATVVATAFETSNDKSMVDQPANGAPAGLVGRRNRTGHDSFGRGRVDDRRRPRVGNRATRWSRCGWAGTRSCVCWVRGVSAASTWPATVSWTATWRSRSRQHVAGDCPVNSRLYWPRPGWRRGSSTRRSSAFMTSAATTTARSLSSSSTSKGRPSPTCFGRGRVEAVRLAGLMAEIADAVHSAHKAGLVHRDLKPANIMIDEQGKPRVADFGLAITEGLQTDRAGEVAGTPTYMAPEQVRGETHRLDCRTDIWALGVILYEGLTGRAAVSSPVIATVALRRDPVPRPKPPRQIDDSIPRELERICLRCLCKRMPDRYGSSIDLADDVRAWLAHGRLRRPRGAVDLRSAAGEDSPPARPRSSPGACAFDKQDSEAFLDLLPGPRGRDGLPESVCFWKARIEDRDGEPASSVGLLYGPRGVASHRSSRPVCSPG